MLDHFFGSKARVKILKLFLLNPDGNYYLRQLARDLDLQVNSVRRELKNLEAFGLLQIGSQKTSSSTSNDSTFLRDPSILNNEKKYYQVNKEFILFPEIKSFILKAQILAGHNFVKSLEEICQPELLLLFGVFLGQTQELTDMLLVAKVKKAEIMNLIKKLEVEIGHEIKYTIMDEKEFEYRREIADVFLHKILEADKIVLVNEKNHIFPQKSNLFK